MHASIHQLAHRAPTTASRNKCRVRWQPYSAAVPVAQGQQQQPHLPPQPSPITHLHTPLSSSLSPTLSTPHSTYEHQPKPIPFPNSVPTSVIPPPTSTLNATTANTKDKTKYALGLVDQTVKSLNDIWRPNDIPIIFQISSKPSGGAGSSLQQAELIASPTAAQILANSSISNLLLRNGNAQLPSPSTPHSHSPASVSPDSEGCSLNDVLASSQADLRLPPLVPIKGFVHEVLRRSRTSGGVLQTALCYLEAIRPRVAELARLEREGRGPRGEVSIDLTTRITPATEEEIQKERELETLEALEAGAETVRIDNEICSDLVETIRVADENPDIDADGKPTVIAVYPPTPASTSFEPPRLVSADSCGLLSPSSAPASLTPLPPLPSPLLCPRRAFLAALILASKFTQDKCYSNRAWAKLSGLPPREIGRCERALGEVLGWRLWVGKAPVSSTSSAASSVSASLQNAGAVTAREPDPLSPRTLTRARSESDLKRRSAQFLIPAETPVKALATSSSSGIRRCATLPENGFGSSLSKYPSVSAKEDEMDQRIFSPDMSLMSTEDETMDTTVECLSISPPETPALSYSPSSSDSNSSDGERTIQTSAFYDDVSMISTGKDESDFLLRDGQGKYNGVSEWHLQQQQYEYPCQVLPQSRSNLYKDLSVIGVSRTSTGGTSMRASVHPYHQFSPQLRSKYQKLRRRLHEDLQNLSVKDQLSHPVSAISNDGLYHSHSVRLSSSSLPLSCGSVPPESWHRPASGQAMPAVSVQMPHSQPDQNGKANIKGVITTSFTGGVSNAALWDDMGSICTFASPLVDPLWMVSTLNSAHGISNPFIGAAGLAPASAH